MGEFKHFGPTVSPDVVFMFSNPLFYPSKNHSSEKHILLIENTGLSPYTI